MFFLQIKQLLRIFFLIFYDWKHGWIFIRFSANITKKFFVEFFLFWIKTCVSSSVEWIVGRFNTFLGIGKNRNVLFEKSTTLNMLHSSHPVSNFPILKIASCNAELSMKYSLSPNYSRCLIVVTHQNFHI